MQFDVWVLTCETFCDIVCRGMNDRPLHRKARSPESRMRPQGRALCLNAAHNFILLCLNAYNFILDNFHNLRPGEGGLEIFRIFQNFSQHALS